MCPFHSQFFPFQIKLDYDDNNDNSNWWKSFTSIDRPCITFEVYFSGYINNTKLIQSNSIKINLKCRNSLQSFIFTYKDHDGSIAHSAAIKPHNLILIEKDNNKSNNSNNECNNNKYKYNVVLSLSGVGVTAKGQAGIYLYLYLSNNLSSNIKKL